jgi:phosphate transport system permease protein
MSEYGKGTLGLVLRFCTDLLSSTPAILMGSFAYALFVAQTGFSYSIVGFSMEAGIFALILIQIPLIAKGVENVLKGIPDSVREGGLVLGVPRWRVILQIVLRAGMSGVLGALLLSAIRISGEAAPFLFAGMSPSFKTLPLLVFAQTEEARVCVFWIVAFVFVFNFIDRALLRRREP